MFGTVLMSSFVTFLLQNFVFQHHYICISLCLLLLSLSFPPGASSTQVSIRYYAVHLATPYSSFLHAYCLSVILNIALLIFHIQTRNLIIVLYSLSYVLVFPALSSKFYLSKSICCTIRYSHLFLTNFTM